MSALPSSAASSSLATSPRSFPPFEYSYTQLSCVFLRSVHNALAMALALAAASRLKAEIRLGQAISKFVADLFDEQKASFNAKRSQALASPPSIQDVRSPTAEIDRVNGGRCPGPRLIKVLETVQRFAAIGDIMVGGSQNIIACGVWSLMRLSLLVIQCIGIYQR